MFAAAIKLYPRPDRSANKDAVLSREAKQAYGWSPERLGDRLIGILVSLVPPGDSADNVGIRIEASGGTLTALCWGCAVLARRSCEGPRNGLSLSAALRDKFFSSDSAN